MPRVTLKCVTVLVGVRLVSIQGSSLIIKKLKKKSVYKIKKRKARAKWPVIIHLLSCMHCKQIHLESLVIKLTVNEILFSPCQLFAHGQFSLGIKEI